MRSLFLHNFGTPLIQGPECDNHIETNLVAEKYVNPELGYLKLTYDKADVLSDVTIIYDGNIEENNKYSNLKIEEAIGKLRYKDFKENIPLTIKINNKGRSHLGGPSNDFAVPKSPDLSKFQYFGLISKDEPNLAELEFDVKLTFPLFCSAGELYLTYNSPNKPQIYNKDEFWTEEVYNDLDKDFEVEYQKTPISFEQLEGRLWEKEEIGRGGIYLSEFAYCYDRPLSPITKKPMKFLCQIDGGKEVPVSKTSVSKDYKLFNYGFNHLQFYSGNGEITIFYENETRLVLYIIGGS